ncbi:hypothetical protein BBP40_010927 [Aspergillus hancockii]|nr:hypothetical protein BBP40_010927 [Aspergillus hancockii]
MEVSKNRSDIWNLGVRLRDVLEGKKLLPDINPTCVRGYNEQRHFAHYDCPARAPSKRNLKKGERTSLFYQSGPTIETD